MKKVLTLCIIYNDNEILLGMKKRGLGKERWNGFGGKIEKGESLENAALREVHEEAGIILQHLNSRGMLSFTFDDGSDDLEVHLFSAEHYEGKPIETEEMKPQWFPHENIPYENMWADDVYWLPKLLSGEDIQGTFHFKDTHTLLSHKLK